MKIFYACVFQTACVDGKETLREVKEDEIRASVVEGKVTVGGELNGHVGSNR